MSAVEKDQLLRKRDRFERLSPAEQDRLRKLDETLASDSQGEQLRSIMLRYHNWLSVLPSSQRNEIVRLPAEERVAKIKERLAEQDEKRRQELAKESINFSDESKIRYWLNEVYSRVEPKLLEELEREQREEVLRFKPEFRFPVVTALTIRRKGMEGNPLRHLIALEITAEDQQRLIDTLSDSAQQYYHRMETDENRRVLVQNWISAATAAMWRGFARSSSRVSGDQLRRILENADPKLRDQLDYRPPDQIRAWIEWTYREDPFRRRGGGFRGPRGGGRRGEEMRPPDGMQLSKPKPPPQDEQPGKTKLD
jgi:hypothetical protein